LSEIDEFAESLLEESKRFLEKAIDASGDPARTAYLHAALMLSFCALEAHINAIADELAQRSEFSTHERAFLLEQDVRLGENGEFQAGGLRMVRLEDRMLFLHLRVGGVPLDRTATWWSNLNVAMGIRNRLTHPKGASVISADNVQRAIEAIIQAIDAIYRAVYARPFPSANMGLDSKLTF
jgi:hypothetical protein